MAQCTLSTVIKKIIISQTLKKDINSPFLSEGPFLKVT
jgi:hypothetical protein